MRIAVVSITLSLIGVASISAQPSGPAESVTINIVSPMQGDTVSGTVRVVMLVRGAREGTTYRIAVDNNQITAPARLVQEAPDLPLVDGATGVLSWNSVATTNGAHRLTAVASDRDKSARVDVDVVVSNAVPQLSAGATVPVFFATDRRKVQAQTIGYGAERNTSGEMSYGRFDVQIPKNHRYSRMERPTRFWAEAGAKHFVITVRRELPRGTFFKEVSAQSGTTKRKQALVFVHGFNVSFEDAIYRTAQIAYDMAFDGVPILFSWPSTESLSIRGYMADAATIDWAAVHLRQFLEDLSQTAGVDEIHIIAHSMGNKALMGAIASMTTLNNKKFGRVILTAPDVDAGVFEQLARAIQQRSIATTLYISSFDHALHAAGLLQRYPRAGDSSNGPLVLPGVDTIDASELDTDLIGIGHSYYSDRASVVADIHLVIRGMAPADRPRIRPVQTDGKVYWAFVP
jgi:esterase/lipase superfamily enzyme